MHEDDVTIISRSPVDKHFTSFVVLSNMELDENINSEYHDQCENDSAEHPDTVCPSWTGEAQEIPVVVVMPQDTPTTDCCEGVPRLSTENHKQVHLERESDDVIKPDNEDEEDDDDDKIDGDGDSLEAELHIFERGSRRTRKVPSGGEDGPEARKRSREEILISKIKLQKELMDKIRFQPWNIQKKLKLLRKAKIFLKGHQGKLSKRQDYHQKSIEAFRRLNRELINTVSLFIPWEMRIKKVESHFGSVVASYFLFLRWILGVNSLLTLLTVAFIIVPQMTVGDAGNVHIPHAENSKSKDLETLFNAEGVIKYSPFFYGYYENHVIGHGYMMPLAYLATGLVVYGLSIIIVLRKMAANVRLNKMASKDEQFSFSWKVFNSWDYMVGHVETANNKYAAITTAFKESIREVEEKQKVEKKNLLIFLRTIGCLLTLGLLCASGYLTYLVVMASSNNTNSDQNFFELNKTTWVITAIFIVFPNLFDLISTMEQYHPRTNLRVQLARVFILNFLNVMTLMYSLYEKIIADHCSPSRVNTTVGSKSSETDSEVKGRVTLTHSSSVWSTALFNSSISGVTITTTPENSEMECKPFRCWETYVGQEVFKITVLDLLMTIIMILLQDFLRGLFVRFCNCCWCWNLEKTFPEYAEFKTAENILHLINNQGMIWLGWFFSPGISVMNLVKLVVLAYVRFWSVLVCNVPEKRIFRASRSNNFYYALLLIMLFICCIPSMIVFFNKYSQDCGPFREINDIMELLVKNSPFVAEILKFASKPATSLILLGSFSLIIYYLWSTSQSIQEVNRELKKTLEYERTEGKKKVYAIADAKRARETATETRRALMTATVNSQIKEEIKTQDTNVCTLTKRTFDVSKPSKSKSTFHLFGESENSTDLTNKEAKRKQVTAKATSNSKQLTLRSAMKEAERLKQETCLGVIKLAKLKKFQLDREIKDVEKRILKWTERSSKSTTTETSSDTLVCSDSQLNPHRKQKTCDSVLDNFQINQSINYRNKKDQSLSGVCEPTIQHDVTAHCSQDVSGQRNLKRVACREKKLSKNRSTIKIGRGTDGSGDEEEDDDENKETGRKEEEEEEEEVELDRVEGEECIEEDGIETRIVDRKYPIDVYTATQQTRRGCDNHGFVDIPERDRKNDVSQSSTCTLGNMLNIAERSVSQERCLQTKSPDNRHTVMVSGDKRTMRLDKYHSKEHLHSEDEYV